MDINEIFTEAGMRETTSAFRDQHIEDARQYGQLGDIIKSRLEQQTIDGDGRFSARRRARKVSRQVRRMERASRRAAAAAEALHGSYVSQVVELPQRRELAATRKEERRQRRSVTAGQVVANSLQRSTNALNGLPPQEIPQVSGTQQPVPQFVDPLPHNFNTPAGASQDLPSISQFFDQEAM